uniref:60S ribosomal protein L28 n=1 Tax=Trichuris muris TaxID=70415 RepID=A0A5S6QEP4_TRIMR
MEKYFWKALTASSGSCRFLALREFKQKPNVRKVSIKRQNYRYRRIPMRPKGGAVSVKANYSSSMLQKIRLMNKLHMYATKDVQSATELVLVKARFDGPMRSSLKTAISIDRLQICLGKKVGERSRVNRESSTNDRLDVYLLCLRVRLILLAAWLVSVWHRKVYPRFGHTTLWVGPYEVDSSAEYLPTRRAYE